MSLNWSAKDVTDEEILKDGVAVRNISFATMSAGINKITEENYREFYRRYTAAMIASGISGPTGLDLETVHRFVGFSTNASPLTPTAFRKKLAELIEREAEMVVQTEERQAAK